MTAKRSANLRSNRFWILGATLLIAWLALLLRPPSAGAEIRIAEGDDCPAVIQPVAYLYQAFFLREPDPQGLDFWVRYVTSDRGSLSSAAALFALSPEYLERYGEMTNEQFVRALYPNVFGRAPDEGGLRFWVNDLNTGQRTRSEVILVWSISEEFSGTDDVPSPLIYDFFRQELWCGTGSAVIEVPRLPLEVGQSIAARVESNSDYMDASIIGLAANGTHVLATGGAIDGEPEAPPINLANMYIHPNVGAAVDRYEVRISGEGSWVVISSWQPPPWRQW